MCIHQYSCSWIGTVNWYDPLISSAVFIVSRCQYQSIDDSWIFHPLSTSAAMAASFTSSTGLDMLLLAREMGYTGVALKACKGQSQALLMAAAGQIHKMFRCVQDLTCPGASLIQSAGLAAHVPGVAGIEANAREYVPAANAPWQKRFPGIFNIAKGRMATETIAGPGLGAI